MIFEVCEDGSVILKHFSNRDADPEVKKHPVKRKIVNVHVSGENKMENHVFKNTGCSGDLTLKYHSHKYYENELGAKLEITQNDSRMSVISHYQFYNNTDTVRAWTTVKNISDEPLGLEYVSSFTYTGFNDGKQEMEDNLLYHICHNSWNKEFNWQTFTPPELGHENVVVATSKRILVSNTGTWSTKEYIPMGAIENTELKSVYLWQIESNGSWEWEISGIGSLLYLNLSGPTDNEHAWYKELDSGESFESVTVAISLGENFNSALKEMTLYRRNIYKINEANAKIPVIFNDYMNCLGANPTEENEIPIIDLAAKAGAEYYCMDAGWHEEKTWGWMFNIGEWQECAARFPHGLKKVFDHVKEKGMVPGIWVEIEVMGIDCPIAKEWPDECFFMKHGKRVATRGRYQLDFRSTIVRDYVTGVVDRLIRDYGIGYFKFDYNQDSGVGTEANSDSLGDGLLEHNRAVYSWLCEISAKYPDLIIENCASGGMRMDYKQLSLLSIQSTSDQTNYLWNANIASKSSTAVLPEQSAVWAYPRGEADENNVVMNMVNSLLQRIHLSGKIFDWSDWQMAIVQEAIECYKSYRHEIPLSIPFYPLGLAKQTDPFFCSAYYTPSCVRMAVWRMDGEDDTVFIPVATEYQNTRIIYPKKNKATVTRVDGGVKVTLNDKRSAIILEIY